jgi:hypothetical protein
MADRMEMIGRKWRVTSNVLVVVVVRMEKKRFWRRIGRLWCCSVHTSSVASGAAARSVRRPGSNILFQRTKIWRSLYVPAVGNEVEFGDK